MPPTGRPRKRTSLSEGTRAPRVVETLPAPLDEGVLEGRVCVGVEARLPTSSLLPGVFLRLGQVQTAPSALVTGGGLVETWTLLCPQTRPRRAPKGVREGRKLEKDVDLPVSTAVLHDLIWVVSWMSGGTPSRILHPHLKGLVCEQSRFPNTFIHPYLRHE